MSETPRETRVLNAVVSLVDSLLDDFDVVDLLTGLTERCAELLDIEAAGILLADPAAPAPPAGRHLGAGPRTRILPAASRRRPVCGLLRHGPTGFGRRYPTGGRAVAAVVPAAVGAGFASVHAVPMRAAGIVLGALNLFGSSPASSPKPICWSARH